MKSRGIILLIHNRKILWMLKVLYVTINANKKNLFLKVVKKKLFFQKIFF